MNKNYLGLFATLLGTAAFAGGKLEPGMPPNLAVDINAPGAARAVIGISIPSLKQVTSYSLTVSDDGLVGGIYVPPGKENRITITTLDARGEKLYSGSAYLGVDEKFNPQVDIVLSGKETKDPVIAKVGTYRFDLGIAANAGDGLMLQATLFDAAGKHLEFTPDDVTWRGEKFDAFPYSCFNGSLCFELPDLSVYADRIACFRDVVCSHQKPRETRGPYRFVAVGRSHTCALTVSNDVLCWGDNHFGQLRSTAQNCTTGSNPSACSAVPVPVECGPGEVCKYQSVTAGAERTCAVDTDGRIWCWGKTGDIATGEPNSPNGSTYTGEIEVFDANSNKVRFMAIDSGLVNTCAISTNRELYCWVGNVTPLGDRQIRRKGMKYRAVSVGFRHTCAETIFGQLDCFGDDTDGAVSGNFPLPGPVSPELENIFKNGGHVPAAGLTNSCAQDPDENTICWGSHAHLVAHTNLTGGFVALRNSYARSLSTNSDVCEFGVGNFLPCTRTCVTALGGDLFCANWGGPSSPLLSKVPSPASEHYQYWEQTDVGPNHVCTVNSQRDVWCFGMNDSGQFGTGAVSTARTNVPTSPASRFPNGIATLVFP